MIARTLSSATRHALRLTATRMGAREATKVGAAVVSAPSTRSFSTMDPNVKTGTKTYMSLYPEGSTDGGKSALLRL
jgi:hypothetical protein